ncbi:PEP-CTERM sorting domain-containing protein [Janthinobacterium sp.]|uniref:PEP-CTERM sorting domain-containing protein n=1 Tax=Janthinobacterium sp. TaxID=1871054 RepID=UPI00293D928F|nr:PEP-CTERM sorting domain-containing protein [Janthinobacterium sp.]
MKSRVISRAALLALCLAGAAHAAAAEYVNNGSFENSGATLVDGSYCYLNLAGHECGSVAGWSGAFPLIQSASAPWGTPASPYGAFLAGLQNQSHFEQTLNLAGAGNYTLSWADAGRANYGGAQTYQVSFGGVTLATRAVALGAGWSDHSLSFNAAGPGVLRFDGLNANGDSTAFIDNIAVQTPVPEPSIYSMLAIGLGLLAFTARGADRGKVAV